jgi:hypothetical protein
MRAIWFAGVIQYGCGAQLLDSAMLQNCDGRSRSPSSPESHAEVGARTDGRCCNRFDYVTFGVTTIVQAPAVPKYWSIEPILYGANREIRSASFEPL